VPGGAGWGMDSGLMTVPDKKIFGKIQMSRKPNGQTWQNFFEEG
jgi:hypothetical protein